MKSDPYSERKKCGECGAALTNRNQSGYCAKHYYLSLNSDKASRRKDPRPRRKGGNVFPTSLRGPNGASAVAAAPARGGQSNGHSNLEVGTLTITRNQVVQMFAKWPLEDQIHCVQLWLNVLPNHPLLEHLSDNQA